MFDDWKAQINDWHKIPLVRLKELLEQESWFQNVSGHTALNNTEGAWNHSHLNWPTQLNTFLKHADEEAYISVCLDSDSRKFLCRYEGPYSSSIAFPAGKAKVSTYDKAIQKIAEIFERAKPSVAAHHQEELARRKEEALLEEAKQKTAEALEISELKGGGYSSKLWSYKAGSFGMEFCPKDASKPFAEQTYKIHDIRGEYTLEEIKTILQVVGGNPRAIAEKLTR